VKYACITRYQREYPVRLLCSVLGVSRSGYYDAVQRAQRAQASADAPLLPPIRLAYQASGGTYGAPRVHRELRDHGICVGKKRVARVMQAAGLVGCGPRRLGVHTTDSHHAYPIAPNLLARQFGVHDTNGLRACNQVWVSDITYVPTRVGFLYLAIVLDLASRRVVGWAMRDTLAGELAERALQMALTARRPAPGLIHHSDRGVQYACTAYRARLEAHGLTVSMSRTGDCWDNAVAESFFATLERELIERSDWHTHRDARSAIFQYIETWYNRTRRHSTLGYVSPVQYEALHQEVA
jgi:putative transposase